MTTTRDAIFGGRVVLHQPARRAGYRVNADALILASFASGRRAKRAFDLGAGVGAVGLGLLHLGGAQHVTMIEIDASMCALARTNADANAWSDRVHVVEGDAREASRAYAARADLVVCNPPYVAPGRGRAPSPSHARSRQGSLAAFLDAARILLGRRSRACFVYPAIEATTLLTELRARGLEPKRLRAVHGRRDAPARVLLVECAAGRAGGLSVEPPLIET